MKVLGVWVQNDGALGTEWCETKTAMWTAFYRNAGSKKAKLADFKSKLRLQDRAVKPMFGCRCARWPPNREVYQDLNRVQGRM
eukprot:4132108-Karenia_brevis.AAC.1